MMGPILFIKWCAAIGVGFGLFIALVIIVPIVCTKFVDMVMRLKLKG